MFCLKFVWHLSDICLEFDQNGQIPDTCNLIDGLHKCVMAFSMFLVSKTATVSSLLLLPPVPFLTFVLSFCFLTLVCCLFLIARIPLLSPRSRSVVSPLTFHPHVRFPEPKLLFYPSVFSPLVVCLNLFSWTCPFVS